MVCGVLQAKVGCLGCFKARQVFGVLKGMVGCLGCFKARWGASKQFGVLHSIFRVGCWMLQGKAMFGVLQGRVGCLGCFKARQVLGCCTTSSS